MTELTTKYTVEEIVELANEDYEAFWAGQSDLEKELTEALTCSDTHDAIFIDGNDVWVLTQEINGFDVFFFCHRSELVVFVNEANTNLEADQLEDFAAELRHELSGIKVEISDCANHSWMLESEEISKAWQSALETIDA